MKKSISAKYQKKFTLLKLIIALAIIGILPVLALSESKKADIKNKQAEAKMILKQIYALQKAYKEEKGIYWISPSAASAVYPTGFWSIRVEIPRVARYTYTLTSTDAGYTNFTAAAMSGVLDDDASTDVWTIDQTGTLRVIVDDSDY